MTINELGQGPSTEPIVALSIHDPSHDETSHPRVVTASIGPPESLRSDLAADEDPRQARLTRPHINLRVAVRDLDAHLKSHKARELHVPSLHETPHRTELLDLIQHTQQLRSIVIETMRFDLSDVLDIELAQLVVVLSAHQPPGQR